MPGKGGTETSKPGDTPNSAVCYSTAGPHANKKYDLRSPDVW